MRRRPFGVRVIAVASAVALGAITLPLVSVLAASVPGLGPALTSPAAAAAPLSCVAPSMYNVDASGNLYSLNVTTLVNTTVVTGIPGGIGTGSVNALGISADGTTAYTTNNTVTGGATTVTVANIVAGTKTSFAATAAGTASIIAGAVDPVNGNYYYGGWNSAGTVFNLFVFSVTAHTTSLVGTLTPNVAGQTFSNGDLVFDASGNVVVLAGSNANVAKLVAVTAAALAGASGGALAFTTLSTITSTVTENYVGIAFDTSSTLFVETLQGLLFSVNANSGASTLLGTQTGLGGNQPRDLASCTFNGTLTAQKNIVGRAVPGDQFRLTITGNNVSSGNVGTTSGNTTGVQGGAAVAGPVVGVPGAAYGVTEMGAPNTSTGLTTNLGDYVTTFACLNGSTTVTTGTGTVASIPSFPQPSGSSGAAVVCTFTNTPETLTITKATSTASYSAVGDTIRYTYTVVNNGPLTVNNVTVADNPIAPAGPLTTGPTCNPANGSITLTPTSSVVCSGTYVVTQADLDNGSVNDTSTVTGSVVGGGLITAVSNQVTVPAVRADSISVTKSPSPTFVTAANQSVTYTFTVTNTGNQTLSNVGVSDVPALNATATCTGRTNPTATCSGTTTILLPGQVATFTGTYTVTTANFTAGSFTDTATASGTPPGGGSPVTGTAMATVNTAKISVTKTANPTTVTAANQTVTYTFVVTNNGTVPLSNVGVTDVPALATGPTCTGLTNPTAGCSGTTVPSLAPGQVATFTGTYSVTTANFTAGSFTDTATASGTPPGAGAPITATATATVNTAKITLTKTANPTTVTAANQTVTYTFVVTNNGTVPLTNVGVTDVPLLATGPSCTGLTNPTAGCSGTTVPSLAPNQVATFSGTYIVTQANMDAGSFTDTGTASGTPSGASPVMATSMATVNATPAPAISVTKTPSPTFVTAAGQTVTYTFTVTNTGTVTLHNVGVSDDPALNATATCTGLTNPTAPCSGTTTTLAPHQIATFSGTYTVTVANFTAGSFTDTATASGTPPAGGSPVTSTAMATVNTAQITLTKTAAPTTVTPTDTTVTYTFAVRNTGTVALTNVDVTDAQTAPSLDADLGAITCGADTNGSFTLAPGATASCTATYTVSQADRDAGTISDLGTVTGTPPSGPNVSATSPATVAVTQAPAITITKTAAPTTVTPTDTTVTYTFAVENTGNVTLSNVDVTDAQTAPSLDADLGAITCGADTNGSFTLAPGATASCTATYTVSQADRDAGTISDLGTVTGTPPSGPNVSATSPATVAVTQAPAITITKTAAPTTVTPTDTTVTYTFAVENTGNVTLTSVDVTDAQTAPSLDADLGAITCGADTNGSFTLAPGATASCTATYTVSQADRDAGTISDLGTVTGTPPSGPNVSATSPATVAVTQAPAITITKTAAPTTVTPTDTTVTYTFAVENTGNVTLTNVDVTDAQTAPSLDADLGAITCGADTNGSFTLAPGATASCTATYTVSQADRDAGTISDLGTVTGTPPSGPNVSATSPATVAVTQAPAITITKTAAPTTVTPTDTTVTYTFAVENTGNVTLTSVDVTDAQTAPSLDADLGAITCGTDTNGSFTLAPGATASCTATYTVSQADRDAGTISDLGTVTGTPPSGPNVSATSPATVAVTQAPAITITKTAAPTTVTPTDTTVTYTFAVENTGNVTLTSVDVTDAQTAPSLDADLGAITCGTDTNGSFTLAPGATASCTATYTVSQADRDAGTISDLGTVTGTPPSGPNVSATSPATVAVTQAPAITITKTAAPTTVGAAGQTVAYTFAVENTGNVTLTNVDVTDAQTAPSLDADLGAITCGTDTNGSFTLAPGATASCTATYTVSLADIDHGSITDTGTASGIPPATETPVTATSTATVAVTLAPAITITKTADVPSVSSVGQTVTYTFTVTNTGNETLSNVDVTDAQTAPSENANLGPITCGADTNGSFTLAPGATATCTATYTVTQADLTNGSLGDTATATGNPPNEGPPVTGSSTLTLLVNELTVTKAASPTGGVVAGSSTPIVYTITVKNTGTAATTDPTTVTDAAPTGTTLVAGSPACATGGPPTCTVALNGSTITWTIPAGVAPGASYTLTFSVTANASDATGTITNTASWNDPNCATPAAAGGANTPHATTTTCPTNTTSTPVTVDAVVTPTPPPTTTPPRTTTPSTSPALAFTGALLSREWLIGTAAVLLGFGLVVVAHRRRRRPRHAMVKK